MSVHEQITPRQVTLHVVSAFTRVGAGGNPAGVVLDADDLGEGRMQAIATAAGMSETAFVSRSDRDGAKLDFFTPTRRIAHCGHATVAAFALLHATGRIGAGETSKETVDGSRRILIADGKVFMEQRAPRYVPAAGWGGIGEAEVLAALGLARPQLDPKFDPVVVDTGGPFMIVAVRSAGDLAGLRPDQAEIGRISDALDLVGFYAFTTDPAATEADATARMFAPRFGIREESATGMAAGPLAALLHDVGGRRGPAFAIEQGRFMSPAAPSLIEVRLELDGGRIAGVMAGGTASIGQARQVEVPQ